MINRDKIKNESERALIGRDFKLNVYDESHRAYIDPVSYEIKYYETDTVKVKDGYIFHSVEDYYNKIQDKVDQIFATEKARTLNVFNKTNLLSYMGFPYYMSYDTNVFHFIYNDAKYEKASSLAGIYFHYQGGLGLDVNAENIFTDHILTLEELPFKPDVIRKYAAILKRDYELSDTELSGVLWELLKRGHRAYYAWLWKEEMAATLDVGNDTEDAEEILKNVVTRGSVKATDVVAVTSLSCLVLEQNKEKLLSFPDAMVYTIFRLDELTKKKEFDAFDNLIK